MMEIPIVFMACDCTAWPIGAMFRVNRCGQCGVRPHTIVDAPADGKAYPLP